MIVSERLKFTLKLSCKFIKAKSPFAMAQFDLIANIDWKCKQPTKWNLEIKSNSQKSDPIDIQPLCNSSVPNEKDEQMLDSHASLLASD